MEAHYQYSDSEFERQFQEMTMNPLHFSHEAHLRLAWVHINKYGVDKAIEKVCAQIKAFDLFHGKGDKYHHTVTVAAVKAVDHFINKSSASGFHEFILENPRLKENFKHLIDQHYSYNIFTSEEARLEFMNPDLLPFDS